MIASKPQKWADRQRIYTRAMIQTDGANGKN